MKKLIRLLAVIALMTSVSCSGDKDAVYNKSVLIYVAGNNSLSSYVSSTISQLSKGDYLPPTGSKDEVLLLYIRDLFDNPYLMRMSRDEDGTVRKTTVFHYPSDQNSATPETLEQVLRDAENLYPSRERGLILWSHSSGWLPTRYMNDYMEIEENAAGYVDGKMTIKGGKVTSFGQDYVNTKLEIEIQDLAEVLPFHYDYIIFDSCLMGCVEVAYELKDKCDFIAFSPAEIKSQGFPYYMMMEPLFKDNDIVRALTDICAEYYEYYRKDYERDPWGSGGTISLVSTAALDHLAAEFSGIVARHRDDIYNLKEEDVQGYFRYGRHWFFDLDHIVENVTESTELSRFRAALDKAVIYKAATAGFMLNKGGFYIYHYSGLSSFIPMYDEQFLNNYYSKLKWNRATSLVR